MSRLSIRLTRSVADPRTGRNELTNRDAQNKVMEYDLAGLPAAIARVALGDITNVTVIEHDLSVNVAQIEEFASILQSKMTCAGAVTRLHSWNKAIAFSIGVREQIGSDVRDWLAALK